jgi:choline kinase
MKIDKQEIWSDKWYQICLRFCETGHGNNIIKVFWNVAGCSIGDRNATILQGLTSRETVTLTFTAVRTSVFVDEVKNCQISRATTLPHNYANVRNVSSCCFTEDMVSKNLFYTYVVTCRLA